jgi:hypothetical protein
MECDMYNSDLYEFDSAFCCDTLIESILNIDSVELFVSAFVSFDDFFGKTPFIIIDDEKLVFGIAKLKSPFGNSLYSNGSNLVEYESKVVLDILKDKKQFIILSLSNKTFVIDNPYVLGGLNIQIQEEIKKEKLVRRRLDCDILLALIVARVFNENEDNQIAAEFEKQNIDQITSKDPKLSFKLPSK